MKPGCEAPDRDRRLDDLTAEAIFANQWDPQPFHLDEKCAQNTFFEGLAASGRQTASITMRLLVTTGPSVGHRYHRRLHRPHLAHPRPGDQLHVELEVTDVPPHPTPSRGFITPTYDTLNQHGDVRQRTTAKLLAFAKPR
ncbi:MaoC/PaaZ C-terminal domain-containing protein [Nocardia cyriacigeorgica]|uniref:MaoC-like domain-containing protein n=1 Tax=Nocardia cyriacigeorgica TaxID=135487 RepID=A0A4U8W6J2_9NOCA|nr:MaoC/PaaZ C-terminal domain-containing protein [Nocardia cyriacigeorgica]VFA97807.1 Uncharacterised protein [Nocardia cyriacigeorgica]